MPVEFEHHAQLGESAADVALLPGIHGGFVDLLFVLAELLVFLLLAIDFREQLQGAGLFGPQLQHILQGFAGMWIGVIVDVLLGQAVPVFNLLLAATVFDLALQASAVALSGSICSASCNFCSASGSSSSSKRARAASSNWASVLRRTALSSWRRSEPNLRVHMAFGFDLAENLAGKLKIAVGQRFGGALQSRASALGVEEFDRLVAQTLCSACRQTRGRWRNDARPAWPWLCERPG